MSELNWSANVCPRCGAWVPMGAMSLKSTCDCGMVFVDVAPRGWFESEALWNVARGTPEALGEAAS